MGVMELFGATAGVLAACMLVLWLLSLALRDASIADIFWGLGFTLIGVLTFLWTNDGSSARRGLIAALVSLWGLRLAVYLLWRNAGRGEDPRYVAMRRHWGARFWWISLFSVFAFQGVLLWIVSLPVQLGQLAAGGPLGALDALGIALFALGLSFEAVGDWQLARFKADPANAGRVMDQGLWRYTRHPNYFGDCCVWWGLFVLALSTPYGIWSAIGPVLMTFLLMRVSGVPLLERSIHKRRPDYVEYARRTSAFFPRPPRQPSRNPAAE
jgi:steroid 5-alpha reductase family enzyme